MKWLAQHFVVGTVVVVVVGVVVAIARTQNKTDSKDTEQDAEIVSNSKHCYVNMSSMNYASIVISFLPARVCNTGNTTFNYANIQTPKWRKTC